MKQRQTNKNIRPGRLKPQPLFLPKPFHPVFKGEAHMVSAFILSERNHSRDFTTNTMKYAKRSELMNKRIKGKTKGDNGSGLSTLRVLQCPDHCKSGLLK